MQMQPIKKTHNSKKRKSRKLRMEQQVLDQATSLADKPLQSPLQSPLQVPNHNKISPISKILGISLDNDTSAVYNNDNDNDNKSLRDSSKTVYERKKIIIDTQKDNQPVKRCTIRTIRKTNPLGAILIKRYLKNKIPRTLKRQSKTVLPHFHIQPVIPTDTDLGLFPHQRNDNIQLKILDNNVKLSPINELPDSENGK